MVTPGEFRQAFPAFANPDAYSDFSITFWTGVAVNNLLDPNLWGEMLDYGTMLYVAHRLVLAQRDVLTSLSGGIPGATLGVLTAKAVDKVSASYDVSGIQLDGAGEYNATSYGIQLWKLMGQFGAAGFQQSGGFPYFGYGVVQ